MAKLKDLAIIQNGQIMSRLCDKNATEGKKVKVITPKSINNGVINHEDLGENVLRVESDESKLLFAQEGDIIIKLSTPYDSAIIRENDQQLVIPSFCALIRCNENVDKEFILALMNSEYVINQLVSEISGAGMRMIKISTIKELQIPNISANEQKDIGSLYVESLKEAELVKKIVKNQIQLVNGIINKKLKEAK